MDVKDLNFDIFKAFNNDWALITSGSINAHNSMTVSWGGMGTIWNKPVITIYIKPCRYTHEFIEKNDYFVVSFFDEQYKNALGIMGNKSGRDISKDVVAGLTPIEHGDNTIYQEAKLTLICRKIYQNDLDLSKIPSEHIERHYQKEKPHTMYIGEVIEVINN